MERTGVWEGTYPEPTQPTQAQGMRLCPQK